MGRFCWKADFREIHFSSVSSFVLQSAIFFFFFLQCGLNGSVNNMDVVIKWVILSEGMIDGGHACDYTNSILYIHL